MYKIITEGKAKVKVPVQEKVSKKLPVFYNPIMEFNRELSVLILKVIGKKQMQIALPLAATGVRGIRLLLELNKGQIKQICLNDYDENAVKLIRENLKLNKFHDDKRIKISKKDANLFLLGSTGFDYIDIDPFGTPNPFLDSACKRMSREGILSVTATDTSLLCGTYSEACQRDYCSVPLRNELMHEIGVRILIRKVQLEASQYEKALYPIFSLSHEHYMKVFFRCIKSKKDVDEVIKLHKYILYCPKCGNFTLNKYNGEHCCGALMQFSGPIWCGNLYDMNLIKKIGDSSSQRKLLETIKNESRFDRVGFYDIHILAKKHKLKIPKMEDILKNIKGSRTHFNPYGIKTKLSFYDFLETLKSLQ